eukprot:3139018-Karenia_brevis.AAC.1
MCGPSTLAAPEVSKDFIVQADQTQCSPFTTLAAPEVSKVSKDFSSPADQTQCGPSATHAALQ